MNPLRSVVTTLARHGALAIVSLLLTLLPLAPGRAQAAAGPATRPLAAFSLKHEGHQRRVLMHLPARWGPERRWPAVLVLHGAGGQPEGIRQVSGMDAVADREGFVVAYPEGVPRTRLGQRYGSWNAGGCCALAMVEDSDDVGYLERVIDRLVKRYAVDQRRIYVTGISNGAQMAYRLACELPHRVAAVAPVAGQGVFEDCRGGRPVPVLHIHGTADTCTAYGGGVCGRCFGRALERIMGIRTDAGQFACQGVWEQVETWAQRLGLDGPPRPVYTHGAARCHDWGAGPSAAQFVLCVIAGGGHTWPGGIAPPCEQPGSRPCRILHEELGPVSRDLDASSYMWEFFTRHALPQGPLGPTIATAEAPSAGIDGASGETGSQSR